MAVSRAKDAPIFDAIELDKRAFARVQRLAQSRQNAIHRTPPIDARQHGALSHL